MRSLFRSLFLIFALALPFSAAMAQEAPAAHSAPAVEVTLSGHEAAAGHEEEKPELLKANPGLFIWQIILFAVFFGAASIFVWPKILGGLKGREQKITADLLAAEAGAKDAIAKSAELAVQLADAQKQAQRVIDEARLVGTKVAAEIKASAERDIADSKARAAAEIKSAKDNAIAEIGAHAAELATAVAAKILARELSAADQQGLVAEAIREISAKN